MGVYVLDSNFFIQAHRSYYPFDVVPSFWNKIKELAERGIIVSIDKVRDELYSYDKPDKRDLLAQWCQENLPVDFFKDTSSCISDYVEITQWTIAKNHYNQEALNEFLDAAEADAWLVAYAKQNSVHIITHETSEPQRKSKVKIPDVCLPFDINCLTTINMFRELGESF